MSESKDMRAIDYESKIIGHPDRRPLFEQWTVEKIYNLWFRCPKCKEITDEYFKCAAQYRKPGVAKCKHCGAMVTLRGRRHDEEGKS
jgi:transcription elongation factor Elf1